MKFKSKLRLLLGIILVFLLVGGLTTYLNFSLSRKDSIDASITSKKLQVGSSFAGTITSINTSEGEIVPEGTTLLTVQSPDIALAIENNRAADNNSYKLLGNQTVAILATKTARVDTIFFDISSYVSANDIIMSLNEVTEPFITATFELLPPDYAKVSTNTRLIVTLPDNSQIIAVVTNISLQKSELSADNKTINTIIEAKPITGKENLTNFPIDTPIRAKLILDGRTIYDSLKETATKLFKPGE